MEDFVSHILKERAINLGLCKEWTEAWQPCDQQELIDKYVKGIDFCIGKNYPAVDFIINNFDEELLKANDIYVQGDNSISYGCGTIILRGDSKNDIRIKDYAAVEIWIAENANLTINAGAFSKVFINMYGEGEVKANSEFGSKVYIYTHNDKARVGGTGYGDVMIRKGGKR